MRNSNLISTPRAWSLAAVCAACALLPAQTAFAHPLDALRALPSLRAYYELGVEHILTGYDHLLFLAGLLIAAQRAREVLWAVSAFTLAHSVTLALSMFELVAPNPVVIEVLIALSIAYVGWDNLRRHGSSARARYAVTLGFGLVHGFGFASALQEIGLPPARELGALVLFNLGVESGQLLVLAPLAALLWGIRRGRRARIWVPRAVNAVLIAVGLVWTVQRSVSPAPAAAVPGASVALDAQIASSAAPSQPTSAPRPAVAIDARALSWVEPLCEAFQTLPRERRAACAGQKPGALLTSQCTRLLTQSVRDGALTFAPDQAERCVSAMQDRYQGCDWTAATALPAVPACTALLQGRSPAGATCHSSLECAPSLHCQGVGPLDAGVCAPAAAVGTRCELGLDPLAVFVPHDASARSECEGDCVRGRCTNPGRAAL